MENSVLPVRILSPNNKFIQYMGKQHKYYVKKGLMTIEPHMMLYFQRGNRYSIYKRKY
jgi:hypothetical protein